MDRHADVAHKSNGSKRPLKKPVVFACSGCSFAGRLAYELAQEMDRLEVAEMSCLAGVAS